MSVLGVVTPAGVEPARSTFVAWSPNSLGPERLFGGAILESNGISVKPTICFQDSPRPSLVNAPKSCQSLTRAGAGIAGQSKAVHPHRIGCSPRGRTSIGWFRASSPAIRRESNKSCLLVLGKASPSSVAGISPAITANWRTDKESNLTRPDLEASHRPAAGT